jgi:hypothetical protein
LVLYLPGFAFGVGEMMYSPFMFSPTPREEEKVRRSANMAITAAAAIAQLVVIRYRNYWGAHGKISERNRFD